jgi:hypothetical protein
VLRYPVPSFFILQIKFGMVAFITLGMLLQLQTPREILSDLVCKGNTTSSSRPSLSTIRINGLQIRNKKKRLDGLFDVQLF